MAIVIIEENKEIKGYFSIKGDNSNKVLEYYIELQSYSKNIELSIIYVIKNRGFILKIITDEILNGKKIYKGTIKGIPNIFKEDISVGEEGLCILDKDKNILFAEYLSKKQINVKNIIIEKRELSVNNYVQHKSLDLKNKAKSLTLSKNKAEELKIPILKIVPIKNKKTSIREIPIKPVNETKLSKVLEFTKTLSEKATTVKKTKICSKEDLVMKISYYLFKDAFIRDNEYFLITDAIVNIFKDNVRNNGHFLISIIFRRNGQIKYIQIGIPDEDASLNLEQLSSVKYKQIAESNKGYWFYKYEL